MGMLCTNDPVPWNAYQKQTKFSKIKTKIKKNNKK